MQVGFALWLILLAVICGSFLLNDHYSCQRSQGTRAALRISYTAAANRMLARASVDRGPRQDIDVQAYHANLRSAAQVGPLDCSQLIP